MSSLRDEVATLLRFAPGEAVNVSEVANFVQIERPISLRALTDKIAALPDSVPFHSTIVTGAALGGEVTITLNHDGSYRFTGFMRATGVPSFSYRVSAVIRSASGSVLVAAQHSGKVFGTDTPGQRKDTWDEFPDNQEIMKMIRNVWPDISAGSMKVNHSSELTGVLGGAADLLKDVVEIFLVAQTLGTGLAICLVIGSELGKAGVSIPGLGGVVGLGVVAGSLFIWGPLAIGPAIILGVAAGAIVDALVKIRRLTQPEIDFANTVFGGSLDFERIRLTNLVGIGGRPFTAPTVDETILVNIGLGDAFDSPVTSKVLRGVAGQLLIHELTHAWQIQHFSLEDGFVPGYLCNGIFDQVTKGSAAYVYGPPGPPWRSFGIEAQASIVDNWFGGNGQQSLPAENLNSDYFGYIDHNLRGGVA